MRSGRGTAPEAVVADGPAPPAGQGRGGPALPVAGGALLLVAAGALLVAGALDSRPRVEVAGGPRTVNAGAADPRDISAHNSPALVANPLDRANLAIANRIDTPRFSCALHASFDGGATWTQTPIPVPAGEEPKCYAPDVAFGIDGTLYLSFVTLAGAGNVPHASWIARSRDGGRTLSEPVRALGPLSFQVRLLADPVAPGRLHLTWLQGSGVAPLRFESTGNPIRFATSTDGGRSWGRSTRVSDARRPRVVAPSPAIGPRGELYVLYLDLGDDRLDYAGAHAGRGGPPYAGRWRLVLARSPDRGARWEETVVDDRVVPTQRFVVFIPPFASLAVAPADGRLYAAFHDGRLGDPDVRVWSSGDRGATWSARRVNDTPERDGTSQYLPRLAVAPDGRLDVIYYDRRADPADQLNEVSWQSSDDHGATFGPSVRISDRPFDSRIGFGAERGLPELGSRLGLLSTDSTALAVWADTRAGTPASGKQDLGRALVVLSEPDPPPGWARSALRYGAVAAGAAGLVALGLWIRARRRRRPLSPAPPARL